MDGEASFCQKMFINGLNMGFTTTSQIRKDRAHGAHWVSSNKKVPDITMSKEGDADRVPGCESLVTIDKLSQFISLKKVQL